MLKRTKKKGKETKNEKQKKTIKTKKTPKKKLSTKKEKASTDMCISCDRKIGNVSYGKHERTGGSVELTADVNSTKCDRVAIPWVPLKTTQDSRAVVSTLLTQMDPCLFVIFGLPSTLRR